MRSITFSIALRYSRTKAYSAFTRFIQRFALGGIAVGVMALIVVMSVMNGFEGELKQRILGGVPHIQVQGDQVQSELATVLDLRSAGEIQSISPYVSTEALIQVPGNLAVVTLQGFDIARAKSQSIPPALQSALIAGQWSSLAAGDYNIILGQTLANQLKLAIGDRVRIVSSKGAVYSPLGMLPSQRTFRLVGVFAMQSDLDKHLAVANIDDVARLIRDPNASKTHVQVQLQDAFNAPKIASFIRSNSTLTVTDWRQRYGQLFDAVGMEKRMMWLMLALIIAVAAFNTLSALAMVIDDKRHDIAILQTIGLTQAQVRRVFLIQGCYIGIVGTLLGTLLGVLIATFINPILQALGSHFVAGLGQQLPVQFEWQQVLFIAATALILTLVAAFYPAAKAAQTEPSEALRYD
ncbi:ABC transporter permease [Idiomarina sp. MD25a]|uniref:lipoprotein-releasing ABC transporter permease subunit n=1 Tax=Idiomarina sp. MD25a TaxID=1889913 RepID=UPI0008F8D173|nr:lipoprotein-releasing ABC transporter permease subunit [Idiomarina sp. MD25a]OIN01934.1 ABC transporter permease [Idiomarina sp. MD25a]